MAAETRDPIELPRMRTCAHPETAVLLAGAGALDIALQHLLMRDLAAKLAVFPEDEATTAGKKVRLAVTALWTASDLLGCAPSVRNYTDLREDFPDLGLPPEGTIRRWVGGNWADCLRRALLPTSSDGDFITQSLGSDFEAGELTELILACADDLQAAPSIDDFLGWVRRLDVEERFPRRPFSDFPFRRHGGWPTLVEQAVSSARVAGRPTPLTASLPRAAGFSNEEMIAGLREVANRLLARTGELSPWPGDYDAERNVLHAEWLAAGVRRALAASDTVSRAFGHWNNALAAAGFAPIRSGGEDGAPGRGKRPFTRDQKASALRAAFAAQRNPFTKKRFHDWRATALADAKKRGEKIKIPGVDVIESEWGSWTNACIANLPDYDANPRRRRGDIRPD